MDGYDVAGSSRENKIVLRRIEFPAIIYFSFLLFSVYSM